ncbi:MAG: hypothetical protein ACK4E3_06430 [Brevundimonas sp.]|uniref:hypothetical protein n=1 Tax=Brevundimonas sp. TaxID=1871086 RepID=UPI00391B53B6
MKSSKSTALMAAALAAAMLAAPASAAVLAQQDAAAQVVISDDLALNEQRLRETIASLQAGTPEYDRMSAEMAELVRAQSPALSGLFQQLGELQGVEHLTEQNELQVYRVTFANASTLWAIGVSTDGTVQALSIGPDQ